MIILFSCNNEETKFVVDPGRARDIDASPGSCPYLAKDSKGNVIISWIKKIDDSTSAFCYAISNNGGVSFSGPVIVPGTQNIQSHSENLPKIIFKPSGEIIALWGIANPNPNNKYSGLVNYTQSFDNGLTWAPTRSLVADTGAYDQRYYDVALLPNGEAAIIWLDNRTASDKEGSALYYATTKGKEGFTGGKRISEGCCQCCRTALFIDSKAGIHVLYRGIIKDSIRDMVHSVSMDSGQTFSEPRIISNDNWVIRGCPHTGPAMTENSEGLHFSWFTGAKNKGCFYTHSADNGNTFTGHDRISEMGSHPQITTLPGGRTVTVWDEAVQVKNNNYRKIAMQVRTPKGSNERLGYITDTAFAAYPVIEPLGEHSFIVAYTTKKNKNDYVLYQRVTIE